MMINNKVQSPYRDRVQNQSKQAFGALFLQNKVGNGYKNIRNFSPREEYHQLVSITSQLEIGKKIPSDVRIFVRSNGKVIEFYNDNLGGRILFIREPDLFKGAINLKIQFDKLLNLLKVYPKNKDCMGSDDLLIMLKKIKNLQKAKKSR